MQAAISRFNWRPALLAVAVLAMAASANAAVTFAYSDDFNSYTPGNFEVPAGWTSQDARTEFYPVVTFEDPPAWVTMAAEPGGIVDYSIPWSGGGRFTLIHPVETDPGEYREVSAWYEGDGEANYPLDLTTNSLKVEFDLITRTGTDGGCRADGVTFAIQPTLGDLAGAAAMIGEDGGGLAWQGIPGFSIEFDIFGGDSDAGEWRNHSGINVAINTQPGDEIVSRYQGPVEAYMVGASDVNQQVHFTLFVNDPNEGGAGVVRVYCMIDPNTADPGAEPNDIVSYGVDPNDPNNTAYGRLIVEGCIGDYDFTSSIFGFTAATGGCDAVLQVDNVVVTADDHSEFGGIGASCADPNIIIDAGDAVTLDAPVSASCAANLTSPGWDVKTYKPAGFGIDQFKASTALGPISDITGEPDLNYDDGDEGCLGVLPNTRLYPGISSGDSGFGIIATGWICFPAAGDYVVDIRSDDGFEWVIGQDPNEQVIASYDSNRGCDWRSRVTLTVPQAGVYPTRLLQFDGFFGGGVEFTWLDVPDSQFFPQAAEAIGVGAGISGEPLVYGLLDGDPVEVGIFAPPVVVVSTTEKVAGSGTGVSGFEIKTATAPPDIAIIHSRDADGTYNARKLLDLMDDLAGDANEPIVNFFDDTTDLGLITGDVNFPGVSLANNFAARAEGFATFPAPGFYTLWLDWDDQVMLQIGQQVIYAAISEGSSFVTLQIDEAGTYPLRVEMIEFEGGASLELGEELGDGSIVPVNSPSSNITVHVAATSGPYDWGTRADVIPADRKVADVGDGDTSGWNVTLAKSTDLGGGFTLGVDKVGIATMLVENNQRDIPLDSFPSKTIGLDYVDLTGVGETPNGDRFDIDDDFGLFDPVADPAGNNDNLAVSATGYIEFPAAGHYGIGVNSDDGCIIWVAGKVVSVQPFGSGPSDTNPAVIYVEQPGLYDIRIDYFEGAFGASFEIFQYKPDGTVALMNSVDATVTVYDALAIAPASVKYANPVFVPGSAKAAEFGGGGTRGFRTQIVEREFVAGNGGTSTGGDLFRDFAQLSELLDGVIDGQPHLSQPGTLAFDDNVAGEVQWWWIGDYPGDTNADDIGVRVSGYLELTAGGYLLDINSDNGFLFWIGGENPKVDGWQVGATGSLKGNVGVPFFFTVEEDGLYKYVIEHIERDGTENLGWFELPIVGGGITSNPVNSEESAVWSYADLQSCNDPAADADGDGDVDIVDFDVFMRCFGSTAAGECLCLDLDDSGTVDIADLDLFIGCLAGPDAAPSCAP